MLGISAAVLRCAMTLLAAAVFMAVLTEGGLTLRRWIELDSAIASHEFVRDNPALPMPKRL